MELNIYKQHTETTDGQKTINETLNMLFSRAGMFVAAMLVLTLCAGTAGTHTRIGARGGRA